MLISVSLTWSFLQISHSCIYTCLLAISPTCTTGTTNSKYYKTNSWSSVLQTCSCIVCFSGWHHHHSSPILVDSLDPSLTLTPVPHELSHPPAFISWFHTLLSESLMAALGQAPIISCLDHKYIQIKLSASNLPLILFARWVVLRGKCGHPTPLLKSWNGSTKPARWGLIHWDGLHSCPWSGPCLLA